MSSVVAPDRLVGDQHPRILSVPPAHSSAGAEAVDLAREAGLVLDPWQAFVLEQSLGEDAAGKWAAFEIGLIVSRQNGKGSILEARELAGLFLFGEQLILHSAHEFKTAQEAFRRIRDLIDGSRMFRRRVKRISNNTSEVGIELTTGQRLKFVARSTGSGRGFSGDLIILDEAYNLADATLDALMPTMSARPNPQLWYTSSAPDKDIAPCEPLTRIRRRGMAGGDPSLAYFEWSINAHDDTCRAGCDEHDDPADPHSAAKANPAYGIRISAEHVERERASMGAAGYLRERLGVGNYPAPDGDEWRVIPEALYRELCDPESQTDGRVAFAIDASPGGAYAAISVAGARADGQLHAEVVDHARGTSWVVDRVVALRKRWNPLAVVLDPGGPAGHLLADLEAAGIEVLKTSARDVASATGGLLAAAGVAEGDEPSIRFFPHPALDVAVAGAETVPLGDGQKLSRRAVTIDISPLVAVTLAVWGYQTNAHLNATYDVLESVW